MRPKPEVRLRARTAAVPAIPRTLSSACPTCGQQAERLNGAYFRALRSRAEITLAEMARICGVSMALLSRMERGDRPFLSGYARTYSSIFERRRKAAAS